MRWLLVVLVGCVEIDPIEVPVDKRVTLDVVVAPNGLTLYSDAPSAERACATRFPDIGGVRHVSDMVERCDPPAFGCIEKVSFAGASYEAPGTNAPLILATPPRGPILVLEGCGATATVELPLGTLPPPPTVHGEVIYDATNRIVDVGWESDPRASTHLVTLDSTLWTEIHHVDGETDRFATPFAGSLSTRVQSLLPGREQITSLGLVRLWPASEPTAYQLQLARR